jgi:hypothetical protein
MRVSRFGASAILIGSALVAFLLLALALWRTSLKVIGPNWEEIGLRREAASNRRAVEQSMKEPSEHRDERINRLKEDLAKQETERDRR